MRLLAILLLLTITAAEAPADFKFDTGSSVVLVYNTDMPGSRDVADHYAERRHVPPNQILGLPLPTTEVISRADYRDKLETPLRQFLAAQNLLVMEPDTASTNKDALRVKSASIRYAVLCYGVPLTIAEDPTLLEPGEDKVPATIRRNGAAVDDELCLLPWPNPHRMLSAFQRNPFYGVTNTDLMNPAHGLLMVARLDGPDAATARGLVDKALEAETNGLWGRAYFDMRGLPDGNPYKKGDEWIAAAATAARDYGFETIIDNQPETFSDAFPMSQIALYAGWYDWNASGPFAQPKVEFMPGAFAYHLHSFGAQTLRSTTNHWCGPLLAKGAAATMGCVDEPYLEGTPNIGVFFWRWLFGFSFGEAAYASQGVLSWQTTVIGDPLYRPFNQAPRTLHEGLLAHHNPLIEWSYLRFVNLNQKNGAATDKLVSYLESLEATKESAVLSEKLGDLYEAEGMHNLALQSWTRALKLNPSPLQAVRITLNLGDKLLATGRQAQVLDLYDDLLKNDPTYPGALALYQKMLSIANDLHKHSAIDRYTAEIARLTPKPASSK